VTLHPKRHRDSQEISLFTEFECSQPCPTEIKPFPPELIEINSSSFWNPMFKVYFNIITLPIYRIYRILYLFLSFPISILYHACTFPLYFITLIWQSIWIMSRPGSSVGIATDYELDGPGIESRWGRDFPPVQTGPGAHPASCTMGTGSFPGVKCGRGVLLTTHPLLVPRSWKSRAIPPPTLWATPGLQRDHFTFHIWIMKTLFQQF